MDTYLKLIYDDYYNIKRTLDFKCDRDVIQFVYYLSKYKGEEKDIKDIVKEYKKSKSKEFNGFLEQMKTDSYFSARETLHFTYPLNETFKRLDVLFEIVGENKWFEIFGYSYDFLYEFITVLLCRIVLFHNMNEIMPNKDYYKSLAKESYFTKEELYKYFNEKAKKMIDLVLKDLSIDFSNFNNVKDAYKIILYNEHYYLFFLWDFLYNLFDYYSKKIKENLGNDEFNKRRGKAFENVCYRNLVNCFEYAKIHKGLEYDYRLGNHEIDILMELKDVVVIFECKSGAFDIFEFDNDDELYRMFIKVYGNGYKTINDLNNYIKEGNNIFRNKDGVIKIDLTDKKVVYVNLSLYNIEFLQTNIQKIKSEHVRKVDVYPICWNFIDFLTLTKVANVNYKLFEEYFIKRFEIINDFKNLTLDYDEVDAFGALTDPSQKDFINNILLSETTRKSNIDMNFMISNGIYREEFNSGLDEQYLLGFIAKNNR